jgi:transposase-like protein
LNLDAAHFREEDSARGYLEKILWPHGPLCPHCGNNEPIYELESGTGTQNPLPGGIYKCGDCRKRFSVTTGTIFARSHIGLDKWLLAVQLMCSTKKGVSALRLQRELKLGAYRSARFMSRRIRWALDHVRELPPGADVIPLLLRLRPGDDMPRPGSRRQKSVWAEVDEELHGPRERSSL